MATKSPRKRIPVRNTHERGVKTKRRWEWEEMDAGFAKFDMSRGTTIETRGIVDFDNFAVSAQLFIMEKGGSEA